MKVIISHPTGNANVRAIVTALAEAQLLQEFYTTIACFENSAWLKYLVKDMSRREFKNSLRPLTVTYPWREIGRHLADRAGLHYFTKAENAFFSVDSVYGSLDRFVAKKLKKTAGDAVIYGYEDGSFYSFARAKQEGLGCMYDLPIAYWKTARRLMLEEAMRLPEWKRTLGGGIINSPEKLERKTAELQMADCVITPSRFVAESVLKEIPLKKVIVSPFGTPAGHNIENEHTFQKAQKKLRVLFAGSMGQRKGLADLGEAVRILNTNSIELVILGSRLEDESFYKKMLPAYTYIAPKPHAEVLDIMSSCDVFCLPSIVEGRALVIQEAMSRGLPIIITKNTGGEDLVTEDTGFLVPVRSPEKIAEKLNWFLENRDSIRKMGIAAAKHSATYTWQNYALHIINVLGEQFEKNNKLVK